jgi:hypothetical protein
MAGSLAQAVSPEERLKATRFVGQTKAQAKCSCMENYAGFGTAQGHFG